MTTKRRLGQIAREIQDDRICRAALYWDDLRDRVDTATGGELDCIQLDIVTDLVAKHRGIATTR
jgi:hypothetical protein